MKSALALSLAFVMGIALTATTLGAIAYTHIDNHNVETMEAQNEILLAHAVSTCEYGSQMFYVARNIDPIDAENYATEDCAEYLADNGTEWFIDFYGIQG